MRSTTPAVTPENAKARRWRVALVSLLALVPLTLAAQMPQSANWADEILKKEGYVQPPKELADAVLAPRHLNITLSSLSPDKTLFLDEIGDGPPAMAVFATPYHELGGVFVDYKANRVHSLTARGNVGIQTISAADGTRRNIAIPANARVSGARWSPDGKSIAYMAHTPEATHIWITDVATNKPRQITKTPLLATFVTSFEFVNGGKQIAAVLIPDGRRAMPAEPAAPTGPEVRLSDIGDRNRLRTFPSLMSTPHHFDLLEYHTTGQIALIDVATQAVTRVGAPTIVRSIDFSPDGKYARVTRMTKPFSYIVPVNNFGQVEEVWDGAGKALAELSKREINLGVQNDDPPADPAQAGGGRGRGGAGQAGKREVAWRPDGQGFTYLEQEPAPAGSGAGRAGRGGRGANADAGGGDDAAQGQQGRGQQAQQRPDRVYQWLPPFDDASKKVIYENSARMSGHRYSPDMKMLFYRETQGQNWTDYAVDLATPTERFTLLRQRNNDFYANPGTILATSGAGGGGGRGGGGRGGGGGGGGPVMISADGTSVFYSGTQYDRKPDAVAPKAFIDKVNIRTGAKERIYESNNDGVSERVTSVLDVDAKRFVISSESPTTVPQQYLLDNGNRKRLTNNEDIAPDLTAAPKQRFTVERADGFTFRVTVNLPAGYQAGTRLPALFWFYPREYSTQQAYDEPDRTYNKNAFQNFGARSMEYFVRLGYAVVEPDSPIVGEAGAMNNNYEHDLRNNLAAVIDELDRRALVDRNRLAIGGHSYGAFSTVNAMVHTPFFKAGIAGDGNYNRTLTPMGFQNERRIFWDAPSVYISMSPFFQANNLTGALLMYHGAHDQNVGTDPDNSLRLFHALNGLGKTVALYMYPLEDHGPATRETLLDLWARWAAWLDKYVKNPQKDVKPAANGGGGR
ncbi:MAG TPA: prolyl oligopeptidase family serine peptidase [Vicinamibacterales bacterium]|nr:prolyl oligopeptidase family serine peptidase [Vicinamibacterales bacterium]